MSANEKFRQLEGGENSCSSKTDGRTVMDFSGLHWQMERMRVGQGVAEGIPLLKNELSGNNFSWNFAQVPGDVYTDLYRAGEIDNPIFGRNMGRIKWVEDYEWWYNYAFNVDKDLEGKKLTLVFEGVDYSCEVWLNTHYLGKHTGIFSTFSFEVSEFIDFKNPHDASNLLTVKLDPPPKNQKNIAGLKYNFAGDYLTGLVPFGIWRPVKLVASDMVRIESPRIETKLSKDNTVADVDFSCQIEGLEKTDTNVEVCFELLCNGKKDTFSVNANIKPGANTVSTKGLIKNPELWWPWELGNPTLYDLNISVLKDKKILDSITEKTGLREITMKMNPGFTKEEAENPWTFVINGKPMFLRSACWGGQPSFFYGMNSRQKYRSYLTKAKECNINNLRMFGWHPAETKDFYDICDELGITVWTNFSFATQEFRSDKEYLDAVDLEIKGTVEKRRLHPSTIMWMGGEEVFFSEAHVHSNNKKLMQDIGKTVKSLTNVPYADASPLSSQEGIRMGYKTKESAHANSHYYAAGAILMEDFYPKLDYCIIPELTAASSPSVDSLKKFIPQDELWPMGPSYGYHAADTVLLQTLNYEVFGDTRMHSLEEYTESTQIAQGIIFQFSLEHFRRQKPHVSGVALCHFVTNWPIIKWDLVDYYGKKKQSFYYAKRSYQPLLPSLEFPKRRYLPGETFKTSVYTLNDYYKEYKDVKIIAEILDNKGTVLKTQEKTITIGENTAKKQFDLEWIVADIDQCTSNCIGNLKGAGNATFDVSLKIVSDQNSVLAENNYSFLLADQEKAKKELLSMYMKGRDDRQKYGRSYYRYTPEIVDSLCQIEEED